MTKPLSAGVDVPADVETVWAVLTSAAWPLALDAALRDGSRLVSAEPAPGGGLVVVTSRALPDGVPGFLRSFMPADGRVTQTDRWEPAQDGVRRGRWDVTFPGSPGVIGGDTTVTPTGTGSHWVVSGTVQIKIPLVGGKTEGFLAPLLERLVARQGEVLRGQVGR